MNEQLFMIADLDPVIVVELSTDDNIHSCVGIYRAPPKNASIAFLQQGMNILLV